MKCKVCGAHGFHRCGGGPVEKGAKLKPMKAVEKQIYDTKNIKMSFKGMAFQGFLDMDYGVPWLDPPLPPPLPPPPTAAELKAKARVDAQWDKMHALARLWRRAIDDMKFRYPDPAARVEWTVATHYEQIELWVLIFGCRNTASQDHKIIGSFKHWTRVQSWPGYRLAHKYLAAMWGSLLLHEGLELATVKDGERCYRHLDTKEHPNMPGEAWPDCQHCIRKAQPIDAHDPYDYHQKLLSGQPDNVVPLLVWALGEQAHALIAEDRSRAETDLLNEIDDAKEPFALTC